VDLLIEERMEMMGKDRETKKGITKETIRKWQAQRINKIELDGKDKWVYKLITDIEPWMTREFGEIGYHLTQILTEHGCFQAYLHRIGKVQNDQCVYCGLRDTAEHTIF
jgi:hypothetical protein